MTSEERKVRIAVAIELMESVMLDIVREVNGNGMSLDLGTALREADFSVYSGDHARGLVRYVFGARKKPVRWSTLLTANAQAVGARRCRTDDAGVSGWNVSGGGHLIQLPNLSFMGAGSVRLQPTVSLACCPSSSWHSR